MQLSNQLNALMSFTTIKEQKLGSLLNNLDNLQRARDSEGATGAAGALGDHSSRFRQSSEDYSVHQRAGGTAYSTQKRSQMMGLTSTSMFSVGKTQRLDFLEERLMELQERIEGAALQIEGEKEKSESIQMKIEELVQTKVCCFVFLSENLVFRS
jgi:hypothetical protein